MPPSLCIVLQSVGSEPSHQVFRPPDWALPPLSAYRWLPLFSIAVTYALLLPRLAGLLPLVSPPWIRPSSRSAFTQGPEPVHGPKKQVVPRLMASMWPLPVSFGTVSALP